MGCSGPFGSASPSIVSTLAPSSCSAKTVQDLIALPLTCTTQAPHCEVSQPTCVPVSRKCSRRNCTSRVRGSMSPVTALPFTVSATADMVSSSKSSRKAWFFAPTGDASDGLGQNLTDFAPCAAWKQGHSEPASRGRSSTLGRLREPASSRLRDCGRELYEEIVGGLFGRAVDQALAELRQLAADLRLDVVG